MYLGDIKKLKITTRPFTPRKPEDLQYIELLLSAPRDMGIVIIDDFHLLPDEVKTKISNLLKVLADERRNDVKLVLIGINRAGDSLIKIAPDLNDRIETIRFESNSEAKILELVEMGEKLLNINILCKKDIAKKVKGSFHMTQMLCQEICKQQEVIETQNTLTDITTPLALAITCKTSNLKRVFDDIARDFANGNRSRKKGHVPYLHLLIFLSESSDGTIRMNELYSKYPEYKFSLSQVADKGYLSHLINTKPSLAKVMHYDLTSKVLTIEDPKFIFYIQNIDWSLWKKENGFVSDTSKKYDFALSFAGEKRHFADALSKILLDNYEFQVFYDKYFEPDILGKDLDSYFEPIYASEAKYILFFVDANYPKKVWTIFESDRFKQRFNENEVIPLIFEDITLSPTDIMFKKGHYLIDSTKDPYEQMLSIAAILSKKFDDECKE